LEDYNTFFNAFGGQAVLDDGVTYDFSSDAAVAAAEYINDLRDSGCTLQTESYPNPEQAQRKTLITQSSSAGIAYYGYAFADEANDDVWGPIPVVGPNGEKVVTSYQQMIGMVNVSPEANLAAWIFLNYLTSPANQASWIEVSGYFPTRVSTEALITDYVAGNEQYAAALELIPFGVAQPQAAPAFSAVRGEWNDAAAALYAAQSSDEVVSILADFTKTCNDLVAEFAE
jgi:ABC-type glycerol-3-phosphate transport system substrate-binding protein